MSFSIHTAKLDRKLLRDFAMKQLNMSQTTLNLIFHLTLFVETDASTWTKEDVRKRCTVTDIVFGNKKMYEMASNYACHLLLQISGFVMTLYI
ncbi:hypothetical protein DET59_10440 [Rossellomorea aquimaris]|uniref:Uncharacterized protein n=1 Tax=Rossellomorea aquimaris TaxID=189382 RepID=A0A366ESE0_9BACI|nr:hypothetical protein DET59_10440 [Rossellomorea aquimaris]